MNITPITIFIRQRFTWLCYALVGYLAYMQASLGPLIPYLGTELHLTYQEGSFHLSALALGAALTGFFADRLVARMGRKRVLWVSALGLAVGFALLMFGGQLVITVGGMLLAGISASMIQIVTQAVMSDGHGAQRGIALTEANVVASGISMFVPLIMGLCVQVGVGWRGAIYVMYLAVILVALRFRADRVPEHPVHETPHAETPRSASGHAMGRLPRLFWPYLLVMALDGGFEWSVIFFSANYLENVVGLPKVTASTLMSLFFFAMLVGRVVGTRLTRRMSSQTLLLATHTLAFVGFLLLWLAQSAPLNVLGLFVVGVGVANLFPQGLSTVMGLAPGLATRAGARVALGIGGTVFLVPQVLGGIADRVGLYGAFAVVAGFIVVALSVTAVTNRIAVRT